MALLKDLFLLLNFLTTFNLSCNYQHQESFCVKSMNVTLILDSMDHMGESFYPDMFSPLISSLFRDPCCKVWMYSSLTKELVQFHEDNHIDFLMREAGHAQGIELNEFLEITSKLPNGTAIEEQSLVYIHHRLLELTKPDDDESFRCKIGFEEYLKNFTLKGSKKISERLEHLQNSKNFTIIVNCPDIISDKAFCRQCQGWLRKERLLNLNFGHYEKQMSYKNRKFKHIFKILPDLIRNKNFDLADKLGVFLYPDCLEHDSVTLFINDIHEPLLYHDYQTFLYWVFEALVKSEFNIKIIKHNILENIEQCGGKASC